MEPNLNVMQRYVVEEYVEEFRDGVIDRRELLRRVTFFTGSAAATLTVLATLGCNVDQAPPARASVPGTTATATSSAAPTAAALPYANPPAQRTTDGVTVQPNDPRIVAAKADVRAADGASLIGYWSRPAAAGTYPGVVVVHENRGLTEHIRDVTRRFATAGFVAVGIDLLSRVGGADKITDGPQYSSQLSSRSVADQVADEKAALDFLAAASFVDRNRLAMTGYCFGGGVTWSCVNAGLALKAAAPYYGFKPADISGLAKTKTAVLGVFAETDARVTGAAPDLETALKQSGAPYAVKIYKGAGHAFHNDTGNAYSVEAAGAAWQDTIEWFKKYA